MTRELKRTNRQMSHFEEDKDTSETVNETEATVVDSDINSVFSDNNTEENVSTSEPEVREEYVVSTSHTLVLGGKRYVTGSVVPENLVTDFFIRNGHIVKRRV